VAGDLGGQPLVAAVSMRRLVPILWLSVTAGCALPPRPPVGAPPPPAVTAPSHDVVAGSVVIRVDPDGPLAGLGHRHLIRSEALAGTVAMGEPVTQTGFTLELPLASLEVDPPDAVADVPEERRLATRRNMLGPAVLDAARFPVLTLTAQQISGGPESFVARTQVGLRGASHSIDVPVRLQIDGSRLIATGEFTVSHADLGLRPFAVGMGALRVAETIVIRYRLEARPRGNA